MHTSNFIPAVVATAEQILRNMRAHDCAVTFSLLDNSDRVQVSAPGNLEVVELLPDVADIIRQNYKTKGTTTANNYRRLAALVLACRDLGLSFREYRWLRNQFN